MKRFFMALCLFGFTASLGADIKYNAFSHTFYSLPMTSDIDQEQYNELFKQSCIKIGTIMAGFGISAEETSKYIISQLKTVGTPAALRLLTDITKNGLSLSVVYYASTMLYTWESIVNDAYKNPPYGLNSKYVQEFLNILSNVATMIITCWNSGIYGVDVYSQMTIYLEKLRSPVALSFLNNCRVMTSL